MDQTLDILFYVSFLVRFLGCFNHKHDIFVHFSGSIYYDMTIQTQAMKINGIQYINIYI